MIYNKGILDLSSGAFSWRNSTIKALIVDNGYTFDKSDLYVSNVSAHEVTNAFGTGYERKLLTGRVGELTGNIANLQADDIVYADVQTNETWDALVIYNEDTSDATSALLIHLPIALITNGSEAVVSLTNIIGFDND